MILRNNNKDSSMTSRMPRLLSLLLLLLAVSTPPLVVLGDFNDTYDLTYDCPAVLTTCQPVCVRSSADCPIEMLCGSELCPDGTCSGQNLDGTCDDHQLSPCQFECAPVACKKIDNTLDECYRLYNGFYNATETCGVVEIEESIELLTFTEFGFVLCYIWFALIPILLFIWCYYNQIYSPVFGSTKNFDLDIIAHTTVDVTTTTTTTTTTMQSKSKSKNNKSKTGNSIATNHNHNHHQKVVIKRVAWQTGYRYHPIGNIMYFMTITTIVGIYVLLSWLCIQYYIQQGAITWWAPNVTKKNQVFDDDKQILLCFILVWMYGLIFIFSLKFPYSIFSIHLRRCDLAYADYVAVGVKRLDEVVGGSNNLKSDYYTFRHDHLGGLKGIFGRFHDCAHVVMTWVFSDRYSFGCQRKGDRKFELRPVQRDDTDGTFYITFEFRRYNLVAQNQQHTQTVTSSSDHHDHHHHNTMRSIEERDFRFVPGVWKDQPTTCGGIMELAKITIENGLTKKQVDKLQSCVGLNKIEMESPSFWRNLKREFSTPFYTYQIFMVFSWIPLWYYYMAFTWAIVIVIGAVTVSLLQYRNERNLYRMAHQDGTVIALRQGQDVELQPSELVPGDIVLVEPGLSYCDMTVLTSSRILVDESALTGEATPVGKVALDLSTTSADLTYDDMGQNKRNTIFAGTTILEAGVDCRALVLKTASYTSRGESIRDIFSYKRYIFKFDTEIPVVVTILCLYAIIGWIIAYVWRGDYFVFGWFYGIYVVAGCLPPLLPTVFTVAVGISDDRLAKKRITCTQAESILVVGKVTRAFFDKTGTITKQGLEFLSAIGKNAWVFESQGIEQQIGISGVEESKADLQRELSVSLTSPRLQLGMACCHSLICSDRTGDIIGNYVDKVMFSNSQAYFDDMLTAENDGSGIKIVDANGHKVTVVKRFDFDHDRMTQSVIIRDDADGTLIAFCKGSGEAIRDICMPDSIPGNFNTTLQASAKMGIYQISMSYKIIGNDTMEYINVAKITRDEIESEMTFEGVINFKNMMRENAPEVIRELENGEIVSMMVTGDNVLTGICIGRESGIVKPDQVLLIGELEDGVVSWKTENDSPVELPPIKKIQDHNVQLALSGTAWQHLLQSDPKSAKVLQDYVRVFGRCTPYQKIAIIQGYVKAGFITLMAGDGGNDCGALKAAHVGVALSDAEASIVAPFTSLEKDISSVISVIREGRCALGSAFASYKFVILYGQILTMNQLIAAYFQITFSEWAWVFMDAVWTVPLSFALPLARAAKHLAPARPTASILGPQTTSSAIGIVVINFLFIVFGFVALYWQDWFQCRMWDGTFVTDVPADNYEAEVLWLITGYQVISSATVFNFGYEFRQAWIRNWVLVLLLAGFTIIHFYITLVPGYLSCFFRINCLNEYTFGVYGAVPIQNDFNTTVMPESFRRTIVILMGANALVAIMWDYFVVNGTRRYIGKKRRRQQEAERELIDDELEKDDLTLHASKEESSDESQQQFPRKSSVTNQTSRVFELLDPPETAAAPEASPDKTVSLDDDLETDLETGDSPVASPSGVPVYGLNSHRGKANSPEEKQEQPVANQVCTNPVEMMGCGFIEVVDDVRELIFKDM